MNLTFCNTTAEYEAIEEEPIWHGLEFHHFGLILSAAFGAFSIVVSLFLIVQHATHYSRPYEQRHILRILFMVPVYSFVSFLSYYYYKHTIYFEVIRDCYEAFAIASFFALLCHFTAPDLHGQKDYFRKLKPIPWIWPVSWLRKCTGGEKGLFRTPRSGLTWFNVIWFMVFQYCFVRVTMTIVAVVTQAADRYCLDSLSPAFAHVWVMVIEASSVTVAMICLIQFYAQLRHDLVEHQPFLKLLAIKLVVFLVFWQTIIINFLTSSNVIKPSKTIAMPDVKIGIPAMLICLEMAFFSVLHIWAYPWKVYRLDRSSAYAAESGTGMPGAKQKYKGGFLGIKAVLDAFNPWDMIKAIGRGFRWIAVGRKHREKDISYKQHLGGTVLQEPLGAKPGRYQRLGNNGDEDNDPLVGGSPERMGTHNQTTAAAGPAPPSYASPYGGDLGVAQHHNPTPYTPLDDRTVMPGRLHEDSGFETAPAHAAPARPMPAQPGYGAPYSSSDTAYHGAAFPLPVGGGSTNAHANMNGSGNGYGDGRGHTAYGIAYGGESQAEMPDPNQWHAR